MVSGFPIEATCEYETASGTAEVKGGAPASIILSNVSLEKKFGIELVCGTKADWSGTYTVSTPTSFYLE